MTLDPYTERTPSSTEDLSARYAVERGATKRARFQDALLLDSAPPHELCRRPSLCAGTAHFAVCGDCRGAAGLEPIGEGA